MGLKGYIRNWFRHDRNVRRGLNDIQFEIDALSDSIKARDVNSKVEWLRRQTLSSSESGISSEKYCDEEIIVSLTSFGKRIYEVFLSIESIMQGTVKPNRIILWLSEEEFYGKTLPVTLQKQQKRGLQIQYCHDIRSYKKIIPSMMLFPGASIITIDDDLMYEYDLIENLVNTHRLYPNDICSCRMHRIKLDGDNIPLSYLKWDWEVNPKDVSAKHFLTSGAGTLFPPKCFISDFFNEELFMSLCPYGDDIWINAFALLSNRTIRKSYTHSSKGCDYTMIRFNQDDALWIENNSQESCRNDVQFHKVFDHFDLYHYLSEQSL